MDYCPAWIKKTANSNNTMSFGAAWQGLDPQFPRGLLLAKCSAQIFFFFFNLGFAFQPV